MRTEASLLETERLSIGYRLKGGRESLVARTLSLELKRGELVCLLGPNGVGKSTLIRTLAGLDEPLSGRIDLDGQDVRSLSPRQRARMVSVVLTENVAVGMLSAYALVALGRHPHTRWTGNLLAEDRERIEWALRAVGAEDLADRQVGELSDGERQKVMIARALAQDASVLLLDEPTAFVDLPRRVELMRILSDLAHRDGIAVLLSSHDLELALRCADKLWLMGAGGAIQVGSPEGLALNGQIAAVFASDSLDWDSEQGNFRLHREAKFSARVFGEGEAALWTRRALSRIGFGFSEADGPSLEVRIIRNEGKISWRVRAGDRARDCPSLDALIEWVQRIPRGK